MQLRMTQLMSGSWAWLGSKCGWAQCPGVAHDGVFDKQVDGCDDANAPAVVAVANHLADDRVRAVAATPAPT